MSIKKLIKVFDFNLFINIFKLITYLSNTTKRKFVFIILAMFTNSFLEFITIGSIIPFLTFVSNPNQISEIAILKSVSNFFNLQETDQQFLFISVLFLFTIFLSGFIKILSIKLINDFSSILKIELGKKLYQGILYQDYEYHLNTNSSKLISSQIQQLDGAISTINYLMVVFLSLLTSLGIISSLIVIDYRIVLFIVLGSFIFYFCASILTKKYTDFYGKIIFETRTTIIKIIQESLGFIRQIILDDSHKFFFEEYNKYNKLNSRSISRSQTIAVLPRYLMEVLILSVFVLAIIFLYYSGFDFISKISVFGAFILGLQKMLPLFQKIFLSIYFVRQDKLNLYSVIKLLKENKNINLYSTNKVVNPFYLKDKIKFKNICSSYKENKVLENINLEIKKGDVIGIVGKTGSGKSTFIDLLLGLKKPNSGNILIDDKQMNASLFRRFRSSVSSVPQDYFLLDRTVEENIVFGIPKSKINYSLLNDVVDISMMRDFINSQSEGLNTFVGEDGVRLSGGQKQRLAIARALYKKHTFLILDEATSSVDSETEKNILDNITRNKPEITVIMIAHRLQTLNKCNYILELKDKKIIKHKNIKEYRSQFEMN